MSSPLIARVPTLSLCASLGLAVIVGLAGCGKSEASNSGDKVAQKEPSTTVGTPSAVGTPSSPASGSSDDESNEPVTDKDLNNAKAANHAAHIKDPRLIGEYRAVVDETSIPLASRQNPDFPRMLEVARKNAPKMTFFANGSVQAKLQNGICSGFLSKIKGRLTVVLWNPDLKDKRLKVLTLPILVYDDGADFVLNLPRVPSKPLYKKVVETSSVPAKS